MVSLQQMGKFTIDLPPGFRFHPSDEELITHYLSHKVVDGGFTSVAIGDVDLNKVEPWDLPWKAKMGEKEWYFFCVRDRKYPTGMRTNRATEAGYWKATGKDKEIFRAKALVGMKKTLVFYRGRAPRGVKTNWVMHEYRLDGKNPMHNNLNRSAQNEWVICRIFMKTPGGKKVHISGLMSYGSSDLPLPPLMEFSSDDRTADAEASIETNSILFDEFSSSSSKNCCNTFPIPFQFPSAQNSVTESQDHESVIRLFLNSGKAEMSEVGLKPYLDQEIPVVSTTPIDLDCLWNY